jgi:hypothetical protein
MSWMLGRGNKMLPKSEAQRRAMYAAAAGNSTLGIPQSVGKGFTAVDKPGKLPKRVKHKKVKKKRRARPSKRTFAGLPVD